MSLSCAICRILTLITKILKDYVILNTPYNAVLYRAYASTLYNQSAHQIQSVYLRPCQRHNGAPYNSRNSATAEGLCVHTMSVKTMSTAKQLYEKYQPKRPAKSERPSMLFKVICINASINHIWLSSTVTMSLILYCFWHRHLLVKSF